MSGNIREFPAQPTNPCFGCGGANAHGMKLAFQADLDTRVVSGRFKIGAEFQGSGGFLHGGIIATLLDEAMGKLCRLSDVRAVTAELKIEYLRPIRMDQEILVEATESKREGRNLFQQGTISDEAGRVLARGQGRFVVIDPASYAKQS
jgi:uncharacterized protein (TIGR00369 family)